MSERWKPIVGYEGFYEVSDLGRVRSLDRVVVNGNRPHHLSGKLIAQSTKKTGHMKLALCLDGKPRTVHAHRLVAEAFVSGQKPGLEVCHNDGDPANNRADNLRWGTRSENISDMFRHGTHTMANRTHCPHGHEYTPENTRLFDGRRFCVECSRSAGRAYQRRVRARAKEMIA